MHINEVRKMVDYGQRLLEYMSVECSGRVCCGYLLKYCLSLARMGNKATCKGMTRAQGTVSAWLACTAVFYADL